MATITSAGVGSGIDIESIITQLMAVETEPLDQLTTKQDTIDVQISAFGQIKSSLSALEDTAKALGDKTSFGEFQASSSDEAIFTASTTSGAAAEQHTINVITLAESHRMSSAAYASSDTAVSNGTYNFSSGEESFDVTIDASNNTLLGLRDAINDASGNTSISASILNVDGGSRLVLTANEGGTANAITTSFGDMSELSAAVDASFEVDGFAVTGSSNTVTDVIPGITLELKSVGTAEINSERNMESLRESLDGFVEQYNSLINIIATQREDTLQSDNLPRDIESRLRQSFFSPITLDNGDEVSPFDLGLTFDKYGVLSIDETQFEESSGDDITQYINAFTSENGLANRFETAINTFTVTGGLIDNKQDGLENRSGLIDDQIERLEYRLTQTEARYRSQFSAMDSMVAQLQVTSDYLTTQLASLSSS